MNNKLYKTLILTLLFSFSIANAFLLNFSDIRQDNGREVIRDETNNIDFVMDRINQNFLDNIRISKSITKSYQLNIREFNSTRKIEQIISIPEKRNVFIELNNETNNERMNIIMDKDEIINPVVIEYRNGNIWSENKQRYLYRPEIIDHEIDKDKIVIPNIDNITRVIHVSGEVNTGIVKK